MIYPYEKEIDAAAIRHGLDSELVAAICFVESSFKPGASRYEARFQTRYIDPHPAYSKLEPVTRELLSTSMGLLQTMGVVAHEDGLPLDRLRDLFRPEISLEYGCKQLEQLFQRYWQSERERRDLNVISAYNCGTARRTKSGNYTNQAYVNNVVQKFREYQATP